MADNATKYRFVPIDDSVADVSLPIDPCEILSSARGEHQTQSYLRPNLCNHGRKHQTYDSRPPSEREIDPLSTKSNGIS